MTTNEPVSANAATMPRPRLQSALIAAAILWSPCLLGLIVVLDSSYALATFWKFFVLIPGVMVSFGMRLGDTALLLVAGALTVGAYCLIYVAARRLSPLAITIVAVLSGCLVGVEALGFGCVLRA